MGTLRGRIVVAFVALGLATLLGLGGGLFLVLRDLHAEAATARLADTLGPLVVAARQRLLAGTPPREVLQAFRDEIGQTDLRVLLIGADGQVIVPFGDSLPTDLLDLETGDRRGELTRGTFTVAPGERYVYIAATLRTAPAARVRALVVALPDQSARLALQDLLRALPIVALVLVGVGAPLAWLLARSVRGPLRRLDEASGTLARGELPAPLPVEGPREVQEVTAAFNAMTAEVARSRRAQADLVANVRHDLRTPLTVIGGFAAALADGTATGDDARRAAGAIAEETARLERLVEELGALADLDARAELRVEQLDAVALAREAAARFEATAAASGQVVEARVPETPIPLAADRGALERILGNLVENALAAAPAPDGHAWIEAAGGGADVVLSVADDGPGIPPAALPRVFERFYRGDPARSGRGSGLGLAIVAELARAHGGRPFAENLPGGGARVGVRLPPGGPATATGR